MVCYKYVIDLILHQKTVKVLDMQKVTGNTRMSHGSIPGTSRPEPAPWGEAGAARAVPACAFKVLYKSSSCCPCSGAVGQKGRGRNKGDKRLTVLFQRWGAPCK